MLKTSGVRVDSFNSSFVIRHLPAVFRQALLLFVAAAGAFSVSAAFTVPDYTVGETSRVEILTPFRLVVIDPEGTEKLRQQEAGRVQAFFRFNPAASEQAEAALKSAMTNHRRKFLDAVEAVFNQRQIAADRLENTRFQQVLRVYQRQNRNFPVLTNLARLWATGETDLELLLDWSAKLRAMHSNYIRADNLPAGARSGQVRVVSVAPDASVDLATAMKTSVSTQRSNLWTITRARRDLQGMFTAEAESIGKFLAGFVRENCRFDEKLTAENRNKRTEIIFAADTYEPGQSLVVSGAVVTPKIRAALAEYKIRAFAQALQAEAESQRARADAAMAQLNSRAAIAPGPTRNENIYKWSLICVLIGLALWLVSRLLRPIGPTSTALVPGVAVPPSPDQSGSHSITITVPDSAGDTVPTGQIRAALVPHFAKWLANKTIRKLMWHRVYLMESQRQAEAELRHLEDRLIQMQVPIKERLQAYENRVAELEKQLASAREEGRQLIRSQIAILQKKLESERARHPDAG